MKYFIVTGCLIASLFLTACGSSAPGENPTAAPEQPQETAAQVIIAPSAAPESAVTPDVEAPVPETTSDDSADSMSGQNEQSASGSFTGVMGTEFIVPDGFIQLDESPNIGYQYTFLHPDYEIRIVVCEIAPGSIPDGAYETDCDAAANDPAVTYFNKGENWFVQSGYNNSGEEIFYAKESSTDRGLKTFRITYPTAVREFGDPIAADFEKNCHF